MSTYESGRLYLIDVDGETHEARYFAAGRTAPGFLTRDGRSLHSDNALNVRPAVVLDPEGKAVKALLDYGEGVPTAARRVRDAVRAQITPPEPAMEEPTELLERVTDDAGNWVRWSISTRTFEPWAWCDSLGIDTRQTRRWSDMQNPRSYENPREKPATAPQSDAQGSAGGIGRVSDSEAGERL